MFQLILFIFNLIFVALNLSVHNLDGLSYSSEECEEPIVVSKKSKSTHSSKKKKPKRNRSAFIIFSSETRTKLRGENLNSNEMMVKLAELWKSISENEKKRYYDLADQEKNRYMIDLNNFYMQNPNEVIQNKTKKNHIKKPCSAYAIYLKETKQDIKKESPDLKMADILKVVAERWKILSDEVRFEFQRKAQIEKELTQAKINQQNGIDISTPKKETPKKSSNSKRNQKTATESKDSEFSSENKTESYDSYEEPYIMKHQALNVAFNNYYNAPQETAYRHIPVTEANNMLDITLYNQGLRLPQSEYFQFQTRFNNFREDYQAASNISNLLSYLPPSMLYKQNSVDNTNYERVPEQVNNQQMYVKDEYLSYSEQEETEPQTATAANTTPRSGNWTIQSKSQEQIVDDFKLDDFEFDRTLETFGHFQY
jgi:hypothetical protein